jgi:hypothetical protein
MNKRFIFKTTKTADAFYIDLINLQIGGNVVDILEPGE